MMASMVEFVCRANFGLQIGNFELDFRDEKFDSNCLQNAVKQSLLISQKLLLPIFIYLD